MILDVQEFIACYKPLCTPIPSTNHQLKEVLGDVVIDTREYNKFPSVSTELSSSHSVSADWAAVSDSSSTNSTSDSGRISIL